MQIRIGGPFFDHGDSTLAITGGTGYYSGATGTLLLQRRLNATVTPEYDFLLCIWL
tara:strand:+ start:259 stop:426 length:168 start_codon:yes stop_codon:yes gene_type:complete